MVSTYVKTDSLIPRTIVRKACVYVKKKKKKSVVWFCFYWTFLWVEVKDWYNKTSMYDIWLNSHLIEKY